MDYLKKYPYWITGAAIILLLIIVFALTRGLGGPAKKPLFPTKRLQVMAFYEKGWNKYTYGLPSLKKHYRYVNILMPYWYTLQTNGNLKVSAVGFEPEVVKFLRKHPEVKLLPLINKDTSSQNVLTDPQVRQNAINTIVKMVMDNNYSGVNIDFELLPKENRDDLTVFIRDLSKPLHAQKKMISVSVMPKLDGLEDIGAAYDYGALGQLADIITIMTYDKHAAGTGPGSVAPYKWVETNIKEALKSIPANKLTVCIGAYGYDWPVAGYGEVKYISMREAVQTARNHKAAIKWDDASQSAFFNYWIGSTQHQVWFENGFSVTRKVALARKYGLRGVAIWRMGFEDNQYWTKLREAVNK
ncbi:MAG TPA: glycosyl hydrolase family 18 protein [Syntrophomonadaceae bacterium]|nr:glycosyl hydrolase family 18 protein [Syntrophomonadaceae bacterium]